MSYQQQGDRNWGVLIACLIAVPLAFVWTMIVFIGGSVVCADAAAHCDGGMLWPLTEGIAVIAVIAAALAWAVNWLIRAIQR